MTSKKLAKKIIAKIHNGQLKPNDKLPSENQLVIKYQISRTMVSKAFEILKSIGAIYSRPKKGYFVAEFFSSLVKPTSFLVGADHWQDVLAHEQLPKFILNNSQFATTAQTQCFKRNYYQGQELVAISTNWYDSSTLNIDNKTPIIDALLAQGILVSSISNYCFEPLVAFGHQMNLVNYQINFSLEGIAHVALIIVKPKYFRLTKQTMII